MRKSLILLTALLSATAVFAEEVPEIQVTATRVEVPVEHIGDDVEVITQQQIKELGLTSVSDVLDYVSGVSLSSNGGWGKQTSVFMLGLDSRYVLVLVDGVPVNDPSTPHGAANFEWLDINDIERIEVLKGSQGAVYGSEAIGGVVNIITKTPRRRSFSLTFEGGKYDTFKEKVYGAEVFESGYLAFSGENFKTSGFSATNQKAGVFTFNPDNDPFQYSVGSLSFGYYPSERLRVKGNLLVKGGYSEYDEGKVDYDRFFSNVSISFLQSENLLWDLKVSSNREERRDTSAYSSMYYRGVTRYLSLSPTWYLSETTFLKLGLSYRHQVADSSAFSYSVDNKRVFIRSAFLEAHTEVGELFLTGALRVDDHKEFGSHGTYKVSVAYKVERTGTTLKAQYGTGFKAPTLSQLYGYYKSSWGTTVGNPHLEPEESEGWSLGLSQNLLGSRCRVEARYFKNHLWNIVDTYYDASRNVTTYRNEDKAITEGAELGLTFKVTDELSLFGNYTHLRAVSYDSTTGRWEELERRPKETFNLGLNLNLEKLSLSFWAHHYGSRKDTDWSDFRNPRKVTLRSFTTFNCYASYRLNERVDLYLKGINLTDKDYELAYGYNTMGRALFAGVNVSFK